MAFANELVLSDVLCFVNDKYTKIAAKQLRSVLVDFYSTDSLLEAKVCLLGDITAMNLPQKLLHIPQLHHCAGRLEAETDEFVNYVYVSGWTENVEPATEICVKFTG